MCPLTALFLTRGRCDMQHSLAPVLDISRAEIPAVSGGEITAVSARYGGFRCAASCRFPSVENSGRSVAAPIANDRPVNNAVSLLRPTEGWFKWVDLIIMHFRLARRHLTCSLRLPYTLAFLSARNSEVQIPRITLQVYL